MLSDKEKAEDEAERNRKAAGRIKRLRAQAKATQNAIVEEDEKKRRAIARNNEALDKLLGRGKFASEQSTS